MYCFVEGVWRAWAAAERAGTPRSLMHLLRDRRWARPVLAAPRSVLMAGVFCTHRCRAHGGEEGL